MTVVRAELLCTYRLLKFEPNMCMDYITTDDFQEDFVFQQYFFTIVSFRTIFCEQSLCDMLT